MKAFAYLIITLGILLVAIIILLAFPLPADASGCEHRHSRDCDEPPPVNNYYTHNHKHSDLGKGVVLGVVLTCGVRSIYTKSTADRWTWCGDLPRPEPVPVPGPAVKNDVTPDSIQNRYLIEAR